MLILLLACDEPSTVKNGSPVDSAGDQDPDGETDTVDTVDSEPPEDTEDTEDTEHTDDTDDTPVDSGDSAEPEPEPVIARFVALGDAGEGNSDQYAVADVIKTVCDAQGCDFALYLGDNIYDSGVDGPDDAQFQEKFELPYAELDFPFYVVLGNHDYGGDGAGYEFWKGPYQVEYTDYSEKWTMPDEYYTVSLGELDIFGLDTNSIFWGFGNEQGTWLTSVLNASAARWKIVFGHHCYRSEGQHGNAGEYEGFEWLPIANGAAVEEFFDANIRGQADAYFAGHDHLREWIEAVDGTELIVSGAGAKTTDLVGRGNTTWFESEVEGFAWVMIQGEQMTVEFWDKDGAMNYTRTFTR